MNGKSRIKAILNGGTPDRVPLMPITMMFASRLIGKQYLDYVTDYRVLVEGQIAVAERFGFDYVSVISDPTREAGECGAKIAFYDDNPPAIDEANGNALLDDQKKLTTLKAPSVDQGRMGDRLLGLELLKRKCQDDLFVEGWVEGPCAEAADLRGINAIMLDFFDDSAFINDLLDFTTELAIDFALAQLEAGADIIGIGDAASSLIGPDFYNDLVAPRARKLVEAIHQKGGLVRMHICGYTESIVETLGSMQCDMIDIDYPVDLHVARESAGESPVLIGNLDPVVDVLESNPDDIVKRLQECRELAGPRFIAGSGCEIPPDCSHQNVDAFRSFCLATAN